MTPAALSKRRLEVAKLVATGHTNKRIAQKLGITEGTVKVYVSVILATLGMENRFQLTVWAIGYGLIPRCAGKLMVAGQTPIRCGFLDGHCGNHGTSQGGGFIEWHQ